ncbi:DUF6950 family protein [Shimia sp. MIT910701]|uniref:DUF6950 family protein n=1 Tax=Shimia sp. MIT910701 TaxID=3096987 RepID=UPI0039999EB6
MLSQFIASSLAEPFAWGQNDCALWCASGVRACTGFDPAVDLRGTYNSWFECRRVIMRAGGLEALIAPRMARFAPLSGDGAAVVRVGTQKLCALIVSGRAVARASDGRARFCDDFDVLRGWSW